MGKRSDFERIEKDFYRTIDERAVNALLPFLKPKTRFCEPCAGAGDLIRSLEAAGHVCAAAWDIDPQGPNIDKQDATTRWIGNIDCFITNPPWTRKILHPMIENFLLQGNDSWLLFDSDWAFTKQSAPYMTYCTDIVAIGRLIWIPGTKTSGKDNCSWYRFSVASSGKTQFHGR